MKTRKLILVKTWVLTSVLLLQAVAGQAADDVTGSADLELLSRYPNSWIVDYNQTPVPEYSLATGAMKKVNGVIAPQFQQYLAGTLTRITYRLPSGRSSGDALRHFESQFDRLPFQVLFSCDGRACGESNQWANVQLGINRLYGIDREQHYRALKLEQSGVEPTYLAFYTVKRGNKRVYVQLDLIEPETSTAVVTADSLVVAMQAGGRILGSADQWDTAEINDLKRLLNDQPERVLVLVGHSDRGHSIAQSRSASLQLADTLKQQLQNLGIAASQIETQGVGSLAPAYDSNIPQQRVEWLLRSR